MKERPSFEMEIFDLPLGFGWMFQKHSVHFAASCVKEFNILKLLQSMNIFSL